MQFITPVPLRSKQRSPKTGHKIIIMQNKKIKIGITHGDVNGIGYELIMKVLSDSRICEMCVPVVYGSSKIAGFYKKGIPEIGNFTFNIITSAKDAVHNRPNLINCVEEEPKIDVGQSTVEAGQLAVLSLEAAIKDLKSGAIDAVVTAPFNKSNVRSAEFTFPGHTELFSSHFGNGNSIMLMVSEALKIGIVTNHEPMENVSKVLTIDLILSKIKLLHETLVRDFSNTNPKIGVLGYNPHAGDNGLIGSEEIEIIAPAIAKAKEQGIDVFGPFSADAYFAAGKYKAMDATLAMYHDQGMIPFKLLSLGEGVNFTAGISVVRTSPAHGVAYDIAGENRADVSSMLQAIYCAIDIYRNRKNYYEISRNPLPYYSKDSWGKDTSASDLGSNNAE